MAPAVQAGVWTSLFDGETLADWHVAAKPEDAGQVFWQVRDGAITADVPKNSKHHYIWLLTDQEYGDFELRMKVQTYSNQAGNSGVQIRSRYDDEAGWLDGPQVDINPPGPWRNGFIYDETGIDREKLAWVMELKNTRRGRIKEYAEKYPEAVYTETDAGLDWVRERILGWVVDRAIDRRYLFMGLVILALSAGSAAMAGASSDAASPAASPWRPTTISRRPPTTRIAPSHDRAGPGRLPAPGSHRPVRAHISAYGSSHHGFAACRRVERTVRTVASG